MKTNHDDPNKMGYQRVTIILNNIYISNYIFILNYINLNYLILLWIKVCNSTL